MFLSKTASTHLQHIYNQGAARAKFDFAKYAAGLGDPNYWQGGSETPTQPPPTEEEAALAFPTGIFQGMNTKLDPMGQKTTSIKLTPEAAQQPDLLNAIFQANPQAKVELATPETKTNPEENPDMAPPMAPPMTPSMAH